MNCYTTSKRYVSPQEAKIAKRARCKIERAQKSLVNPPVLIPCAFFLYSFQSHFTSNKIQKSLLSLIKHCTNILPTFFLAYKNTKH